jgi:Pyridine nucleotide-disulphide oxidoreductase, dimerisation domain
MNPHSHPQYSQASVTLSRRIRSHSTFSGNQPTKTRHKIIPTANNRSAGIPKEVARAQISGAGHGVLKMIADPNGERLLGVQVVGDSATELIHLGQMALQQGAIVESFIDNVFNFPTYAEAYRVAALDILGQVAKRQRPPRPNLPRPLTPRVFFV